MTEAIETIIANSLEDSGYTLFFTDKRTGKTTEKIIGKDNLKSMVKKYDGDEQSFMEAIGNICGGERSVNKEGRLALVKEMYECDDIDEFAEKYYDEICEVVGKKLPMPQLRRLIMYNKKYEALMLEFADDLIDGGYFYRSGRNRGRIMTLLNHYFAELLWNGNDKEQKKFWVVNELWKRDPTNREIMYDFLIKELGAKVDDEAMIFKTREDVLMFNYADVKIGATHTLDENTPLYIFYPELRSLCNDLKMYKLAVGTYTIPEGLNAETEYHLRTILDGMVRITNLIQGTYGAKIKIATELYRRLFSFNYSTLSLDIVGAMKIGEIWKIIDEKCVKGIVAEYGKTSDELYNYADAVYNGRWMDLLKMYGRYDMPNAKMVSEILMPKYRGDMFSKEKVDIRHMAVDWANFIGLKFIEPDEMKKHYSYMMDGSYPKNWIGDIGWSEYTMPYFSRGGSFRGEYTMGNYYYPPMPYHFENANMRVIQQLVVNYAVGINPEQQVSGCYNISVLTKLLCDKYSVKCRLRCGWCDLSGRYITEPTDYDDPSIYWARDIKKRGENDHLATHFWVDVDIGEGWEICDFRLQKAHSWDNSVTIRDNSYTIEDEVAMESQDFIMIGRRHSKECYDLESPDNLNDLEKNRQNFSVLNEEYLKGSWEKVCRFHFKDNRAFKEYADALDLEVVECVETQKAIDAMENPYETKIYDITAKEREAQKATAIRNIARIKKDKEEELLAEREKWDKKTALEIEAKKKNKKKVLTEEEQIVVARKKKAKKARQKERKMAEAKAKAEAEAGK